MNPTNPHPINTPRPHPTLPADHPLNRLSTHPGLADVLEKGSHFAQTQFVPPEPGYYTAPPADPKLLPRCGHPMGNGWKCVLEPGHLGPCSVDYSLYGDSLYGVDAPAPAQPSAPEWLPMVDDNALEQLATLDTFDAAVEEARAAGGPSAGLAALLARPLKVGGYVLQSIAAYHFLFLQKIGSPFLTGGTLTKEEMPLHVARALLAFASVPVVPESPHYSAADAPCYLTFEEAGPVVDFALLQQDAWELTARLSLTDISRATNWLLAQIAGIASLFPTGEEAGNFQTPAGEMNPPLEAPPAPVLPDGSSC